MTISRRRLLQTSLAISAGIAWARLGVSAREEASAELDLNIHTKLPLNGEPSLEKLVAERITPVEHFYVRNHGPTPQVKRDDYRLSIAGLVHKPQSFSLDQILEKFKPREIEATLTCAGNRRAEMSAIKPIGGVPWNAGAIGNAQWQGALLADVLASAELREGAKHIWFEGLDSIPEKDGSTAPFGGSISLEKIAEGNDASPVLAAYQMNGDALTAEHGFPLRMVVPGYIGARSVKWLSKIVVSDRPSPNHYVAEAYKIIRSDDKVELAAATPIYEFALNAAICLPAAKSRLEAGRSKVAGYALPSGAEGALLKKVELSLDGGKTWNTAKLLGDAQAATWQLWSIEVELTPKVTNLVVRATDNRGNVQPETTPWNLKGYMQNSWHQVPITVV